MDYVHDNVKESQSQEINESETSSESPLVQTFQPPPLQLKTSEHELDEGNDKENEVQFKMQSNASPENPNTKLNSEINQADKPSTNGSSSTLQPQQFKFSKPAPLKSSNEVNQLKRNSSDSNSSWKRPSLPNSDNSSAIQRKSQFRIDNNNGSDSQENQATKNAFQLKPETNVHKYQPTTQLASKSVIQRNPDEDSGEPDATVIHMPPKKSTTSPDPTEAEEGTGDGAKEVALYVGEKSESGTSDPEELEEPVGPEVATGDEAAGPLLEERIMPALEEVNEEDEIAHVAEPAQAAIENVHESAEGLALDPSPDPAIEEIHAQSTRIANSNGEDGNRAEADALLVKTNHLLLQVELKERFREQAEVEEQVARVEEQEDARPEAIEAPETAPDSTRIDSLLEEEEIAAINRINAKAKEDRTILTQDVALIARLTNKIPDVAYEITPVFLKIDRLSADIADGKLRIIAIDAEGEEVPAGTSKVTKMDMFEQVLDSTSAITGLSGQFGTGFTENSGISNTGDGIKGPIGALIEVFVKQHASIFHPDSPPPSESDLENSKGAFKTFMDENLAGSVGDPTLVSGVSDSLGGGAEYLSAMIAFKGLLDERFGEEWDKKHELEKAEWYANVASNVSSQFAAAYKATAGVMDAAKIAQDPTASIAGTALRNNANGSGDQMAGTSTVKFVGDTAGVAASGFQTIAESLSAINSFRKWTQRSDKWNKESFGKGLLNTAKIVSTTASTVRDSYRLALQTGAVDAAQAAGATAAATGAGVAVGALSAIRAGYLLKKYKSRLAALREQREDRATPDDKAETILQLEGVLSKKINRAWVSLAASSASVVSGALALSGVGAIAGIALGALVGGGQLLHTAFKGFRQWRRNVQARKRLETHDNWKKRQQAKIALTSSTRKKAAYHTKIQTTFKSGFATSQEHAGESFEEWRKRQNWATIKVTPNWDKSTGAKQLNNQAIVEAMKGFRDPGLYSALGLNMAEIIDDDAHDAEVLKKLNSRG